MNNTLQALNAVDVLSWLFSGMLPFLPYAIPSFCIIAAFSWIKKQGITAKKMLLDLGYSDNLISQWKKGSEPSAVKLGRIADYLGVSTDYLLGTKEMTSNDRLNHEIAKLTPEGRKQAEKFIEFLQTQEDFEDFKEDLQKGFGTQSPKPQT